MMFWIILSVVAMLWYGSGDPRGIVWPILGGIAAIVLWLPLSRWTRNQKPKPPDHRLGPARLVAVILIFNVLLFAFFQI